MAMVLIVSAAADIHSALREPLREAGHDASTVSSAADALTVASVRRPDLLVVDVQDAERPLEGHHLRRELTSLKLPIIAVTPQLTEEQRLAVFEIGIDDLVTKPFSVREMVLRIRAVLRRGPARAATVSTARPCAGPIEIDPAAHRAFVHGAEVALTPVEFRLLTRLVTNAGRLQSRKDLLADVWNVTASVTTRTVDTHVKRLRAKLGAAKGLLQTVRGAGYRLVPGDDRTLAPQASPSLR